MTQLAQIEIGWEDGAQAPRGAVQSRRVSDLMKISDELSVAFVEAGEAAPLELMNEAKGSTFFIFTYSPGDDARRNVANLQILSLPCPTLAAGRQIICKLSSEWLAGFAAGETSAEPQTGGFYLSPALFSIGAAALDAAHEGPARFMYRSAKCLELICETLRAWYGGGLTPLVPGTSISLADSRRLMQARAIIAEDYCEKLTLDSISRACGLNRAKLTRGFRELFGCTVSEFLCEVRLVWASEQLRLTERAVSTIGYSAGYDNNASFSRAFSRHFGVAPSVFRNSAPMRSAAGCV